VLLLIDVAHIIYRWDLTSALTPCIASTSTPTGPLSPTVAPLASTKDQPVLLTQQVLLSIGLFHQHLHPPPPPHIHDNNAVSLFLLLIFDVSNLDLVVRSLQHSHSFCQFALGNSRLNSFPCRSLFALFTHSLFITN
jgi:hypothetical protein